ncbi:MAG: hypothetical protein JJT96_02725 [Opitutales bacterium]|nr:hypothetical protein [Opitutales bacterium]
MNANQDTPQTIQPFPLARVLSGACLLNLALVLLAGCAQTPEAVSPDRESTVLEARERGEPRNLDAAVWRRPALSYSGFRAGQSPASRHPSREEILEDLHIVKAAGFGLIRVFSSGEHGRAVVELIDEHGLDLHVQVGAYVSGSDAENGAENDRELQGAIDLAREFPEIVRAVSVGNETLVSWSFVAVPPEDMIRYIRRVRHQITQPVTVNDNWEPFAAEPGSALAMVWREIDYASVHTYAYWDAAFNLWDFRQTDVPEERRARAMMDAAFAYARENFEAVRRALDADGNPIPIVIGETGWQSVPSAFLHEAFVQDFAVHQAHPVNQAWYFEDVMAWAYGAERGSPGDGFARPAAIFYFAAFDEPWKQADDNWGLWDADRREKFVLSGETYAPEDAVFYQAVRTSPSE